MSLPFRVALIGSIGLVAATACPLHAAPAEPPTPIQQRVDALLKRRIQPEPLPVNPPNPFQMNVGSIRAASTEVAAPVSTPVEDKPGTNAAKSPAVADNLEVLKSIASRLKVAGVIVLKDQLHVVINGVPRKVGDSIPGEWNNAIVFVKVVNLQQGQIVLRYSEAELPVKF